MSRTKQIRLPMATNAIMCLTKRWSSFCLTHTHRGPGGHGARGREAIFSKGSRLGEAQTEELEGIGSWGSHGVLRPVVSPYQDYTRDSLD